MSRRARLSGEGGFGLIELLVAMLVLSLGLMAIVAGFSSGIVALHGASRVGTAGTLADKQMEAYRALPFRRIALAAALTPTPYGTATADSLYTDDSALDGDTQNGAYALTDVVLAPNTSAYDSVANHCNTTPVTCQPSRTPDSTTPVTPVTAPDGRRYRIDTYIVWSCPVGTFRDTGTYGTVTHTPASPGCRDSSTDAVVSNPLKKITVVVRDGTDNTKQYIRVTSTFDEWT